MQYQDIYCRRLKARLMVPKTITTTTKKLVCLFYRMMKYGGLYVEKGIDYHEKYSKEKIIKKLTKRTKNLGNILVKNETPILRISATPIRILCVYVNFLFLVLLKCSF